MPPQVGYYFGVFGNPSSRRQTKQRLLSPTSDPADVLLFARIIPFQRPLKIKELLQKVTEAFGQQMDMFFMEKEVEKQIHSCYESYEDITRSRRLESN